MRNHLLIVVFLLFPAIWLQPQQKCEFGNLLTGEQEYRVIQEIPMPAGFERVKEKSNSFAEWLRQIKLKRDKHVYLYNGTLKTNQTVQYAVLDKKRGDKDLQQCADAIIRLRAEYYLSIHQYDSIHFSATDGTVLSFAKWRNGLRYRLTGNKLNAIHVNNTSVDINEQFENYLETVFNYAGTSSLASELYAVSLNKIEPGDVFIRPGFPGHAMIVIDVCSNKDGKKMFLLAQSYMPAQDIHIVKNPVNDGISPWYEVSGLDKIITPQWEFTSDQLRRWK